MNKQQMVAPVKEELKPSLPCPFCGSTRIVKGERYFAMCVDCGATGPERIGDKAGQKRLVEDWNHRTPQVCPHVVTSKEGTSHCELAESSVKEFQSKMHDAICEKVDLQHQVDHLTKDIESGFMEGAYARLHSLQKAEQERDGLRLRAKNLEEDVEKSETTLNTVLYDMDYVGGIQYWIKRHDKLLLSSLDEIAQLKEREAKLVEALRFYSDINNHIRPNASRNSEVELDNGSRAFAALKSLNLDEKGKV